MSWSLLNGGEGEYHSTLFLKDTYGKGQMYLINVPENPSDLTRIPEWAYDAIKPAFNYGGVYVSARNVSVFHYDNDVMILYAHVTGKAHPVHARIHIQNEEARLLQYFARFSPNGEKELELNKQDIFYDFQKKTELVCDVILNPGEFYEFKVER